MQWQYIHSPKARILETPRQAYMIINGQSEYFQLEKHSRKRSGSSLAHECCCCLRKRQVSVREERDGLKERERRKKERDEEVGKVRKTKQESGVFSFRDLNKQTSNINCNYPKTLETENKALRKENQFLQSYISTLQSRISKPIVKENNKNISGLEEYTPGLFTNPRANFKYGSNQEQIEFDTIEEEGCPMISTRGHSDWNSYHA